MTIFSDAAESRRGLFRIGITRRYGPYKSFLCPKWVTTLQQGELWGVYTALKIAVYISENARNKGVAERRAIPVGTDSEASRYQVMHGHASTPLAAHQRILRRLFWLHV